MGKKRIAIFADGTWQAEDSANISNIVVLKDAVKRIAADGTKQITGYHIGVGADTAKPLAYLEGAFGLGVSNDIQDLYRNLTQRYVGRGDNREPDELYLFGFSRGAFTARSLAGLIRHCGVLRPEHIDKVKEAFGLYVAQDALHDADSETVIAFRKQYAWPEFSDANFFHTHFVGVFDTVGSLGIPIAYKFNAGFHDTTLSPYVHYACQALAIDEQRGNFKPCLWQQHANALSGQQLVQAWFPGVHCDVGGGYPQTGLADCTLHWMANYARAAGLDIDTSRFAEPNPDGTLHDSLTGIYKVMPSSRRDIGQAVTNTLPQRIHADALVRMHWSERYRPQNLEAYLADHKPPLLEPAYAHTLVPRLSLQNGTRVKIGWRASENGAIQITHTESESAATHTESTRPKRARNGLLRGLGKKLTGHTVKWQES